MKKVIFVMVAALVFCCSPAWEYMTKTVRVDQVAINVCWRHFGPIFPQRWSCESMIKQNIMAVAFTCSFASKDRVPSDTMKEICEELDNIAKAEEALKIEMNKVETGGGP